MEEHGCDGRRRGKCGALTVDNVMGNMMGELEALDV